MSKKISRRDENGISENDQLRSLVSIVKVVGIVVVSVLATAFATIAACVLILSGQPGQRDVDLGGSIAVTRTEVRGAVTGSTKSPATSTSKSNSPKTL